MDRPELLGEPDALQERLAQVDRPHIAPLTEFVRRLRIRVGSQATIPYFDPWDGGVNAKVLFLLEAPGPKARNSGFVSMNNPDQTARNLFELSREAGLDRRDMVTWNAVPWYIGTGSRIRPANAEDVARGAESLAELLSLLSRLRAVVLLGRKAQRVECCVHEVSRRLRIFRSPHPSPKFVNRKRENRGELLRCWREVHAFLAS
ncbi:MAG: uracil-DNA glycosylase [Bryobacterales bacterium]|nr:uracil-DNA glycosylase [Bryobacterales bacterium]